MLNWDLYDESISVDMKPGFGLYLRKQCEYSKKRFLYRIAEEIELNFLEKFNFTNFVCLDVGSNIGYWAMYLGAQLLAKEVHCFEPDPILFSILKKIFLLIK